MTKFMLSVYRIRYTLVDSFSSLSSCSKLDGKKYIKTVSVAYY